MARDVKVPFILWAELKIHRAWAGHGPGEECPDCTVVMCRHCGDVGRVGSDHTCPCLNGDGCAAHPKEATHG